MSTQEYHYGSGSNPNEPPQKKEDSGWAAWAIIVALFAVGLWPVALIMLFMTLSDSDGKKKRKAEFPPLHTESRQGKTRAAQNTAVHVERARSAAARAAAQAKEETRQTVEQVKEATRQAVEQAKEQAWQAVEQAKEETWQAVEQATAQARQAVEEATAQARPRGESASKAKTAAKKMTKAPAVKSSTAKLLLIGGSLLAAYGVMRGFDAVEAFLWSGGAVSVYMPDFLRSIGVCVGGGGMLFAGLRMQRQLRRFPKYLAAMGDRPAVELDELTRKLGYGRRQVENDLEKMMDKGFFGTGAYINWELGYFLRSSQADADMAREKTTQTAQPPKEAEEGYSGLLRSIRRANDRIADQGLSEKIDQLERITAKIFKAVEEDPKKRGRIDTFLNYYLPTTQKLLDSYAEFESTGVEGENLRQAKERIETTMDSIVEGFAHQLDELYRGDAMDVDSDIRVMETLLGRDTASVEKDFGLGQKAAGAAGGSRITDLDFGGTAAQQQED